MNQNNGNYRIELLLIPECEEDLDEEDVMHWVAEIFRGCDMGKVLVMRIERCLAERQNEDETVQEEADRETDCEP